MDVEQDLLLILIYGYIFTTEETFFIFDNMDVFNMSSKQLLQKYIIEFFLYLLKVKFKCA